MYEYNYSYLSFLNRFSITKKRLYDHVLNSLDLFHASSSIEAQIYKLMHSADILYKKSLYEQSNRVLRSAEKLASKNNLTTILLEIGHKQKDYLKIMGIQMFSSLR